MKFKFSLIFLIIYSFLLIRCTSHKEKDLNIAAASNMIFVLNDLISEFSKSTGISCNLITASSGKLAAQIKASAPFDVFISANTKYPEYLVANNTTYSKATTIATGKLILVSTKKIQYPLKEFITSKKIKKIAMANPKTAPYGAAAEQLLRNLNIYNDVKPKLIYGESIGQTNQFIATGAVDIGFTAKSLLYSNKINLKNTNYAEISTNLYTLLEHQLLVTSTTKKQKNRALQFAKFMTTETAKQILLQHGYGIPN